jgi:hypothetical protein
VSTACVPAALFASPSEGHLRLDMMVRGMQLTVSITNISDKPAKFAGEVLGIPGDSELDGSLICGLGHNVVAGGKLIILRVQPQVNLVPIRLFVPDDVGRHIVIDHLEVRSYSHDYQDADGHHPSSGGPFQSAVGAPMLANIFRGRGEIRFDPVNAIRHSDFICVEATNTSKKPRWFGGAILG